MTMAKIFSPIRRQPVPTDAPAAPSPPGADGLRRDSRVGVQPVTNTPPPGAPASPASPAAPTEGGDEESWMAMLELVFAETGWPDA